MKKLKIPIYTPILFAGRDCVSMEYGIARMLDQANPIPAMLMIRKFSFLKMKKEISPSPPAINAIMCVTGLDVLFASTGKKNANNAEKPL